MFPVVSAREWAVKSKFDVLNNTQLYRNGRPQLQTISAGCRVEAIVAEKLYAGNSRGRPAENFA